jgi:hypothetical protein
MSLIAIRSALETALSAVSPALDTGWENASFTPTPGVPYQRVEFSFSDPENTEQAATYRQGGFMQVTLFYPLTAGTSAVETRGQLIRVAFPRGLSFSGSGVVTTIIKTPSFLSAVSAEGMFVRIVRVWFLTNNLT